MDGGMSANQPVSSAKYSLERREGGVIKIPQLSRYLRMEIKYSSPNIGHSFSLLLIIITNQSVSA